MSAIKEKIQKITSRGQITLPVSWRRKVNTNTIVVRTKGDVVEITPARLEKNSGEYTVFDAIRDNEGKGIKATDLVKILKKIDKVL